MIDFHTHILPGIDDGAKDVSVSAAMLETEKEQGVNEIVLTPHYYGKFYSPTDFVRRRAAAYEKLLAVAAGEFFFTLGAEIHFSDTLSVNAECRKLAIGDTRYALVELPFGEKWSGSLFTRLRYFMDETELTPVIAHICRYPQLRKNPEALLRLAEMGCLLQVNASAFCDKDSSGFAFAALKHNLVHCLGSDCHNVTNRAPDLKRAEEAIAQAGYDDRLEEIGRIMKCVTEDRLVKCAAATPVKKFFNRYR